MRKNTRILASAASGLLLAAGGLLTATTADAAGTGGTAVQACYDGAKSYSKPSGSFAYPTGAGYLTTTSRCADINIKPGTTRSIRVCFLPSSGGYYCNGYSTAKAGQWTVVATKVANGTDFWFDFKSDAKSTGSWAA
jgi:hypothetical protein